MPFELREVARDDFREVVTQMWYTYENPVQDLYRLFAPLNETGLTNREASVEASIARFWSWHEGNPTSYWQKVVDTDRQGELVGAAHWRIYPENPYEKPQGAVEAYWHPEGGQREFATKALLQHEEVRAKLAQRPHLYLSIIYVIPERQGRGIGRLISDWGIRKAADMGVELWLEAWKFGKPAYERFGFTVVKHRKLKPVTDKPDEAWKRCEREWPDLEEWTMWRPKDGPYVEGKSVKPWE